ncbi:hypothetical protein CFC21_055941 [Triticum aestivum]|uniref:non-specific serine/threonine protein kinase n=2 Tax=Triticum aestivum TaxID=4565 RepID=A0A3B6IIV2_WHEAT|nr:uncharacterized protein LOC123094136 [Triticum aestivum]KAF7046956.1 hypothetical protein CFC21_055941 [Triticum aestivum]
MEEGHMEHNLLESILDGSMQPEHLPFDLLQKITDNFSKVRRIGDGGFAVVYKGVLQNEKEVAVKRINSSKTIDETLFCREVTNLLGVNHENVVRFLGYCFNTVREHQKYEGEDIYPDKREMLLCFEYVDNGSLDNYITDELRGLEWNDRYNIIKGICNGLEYLQVKRKIVHMDLKPANVLLDNDMTAKITDFGLSRKIENLQTKCTNHFFTRGYCAPEYILGKKITIKCDVYSLGVIILELLTGHRNIRNNKDNVLRRWRHRQNKSGQATPFRYQQVAKLIDIGLLCTEIDPCKRPSISEIIHDINELERTDMQISNANEPTNEQICPYEEDDMLGIEPLELCFPFKLNKETSCPLQLSNQTNAYFAFYIRTTSPNGTPSYSIEPTKGIVSPESMHIVNITLQPLYKASEYKQQTSDFVVWSTKVNGSLISEAITEDMFSEQEGKVVDEVNVTVVLAEAKSKINPSASNELIQFDPPELHFPLVPDKMVLSSVKIVNDTDFNVGFHLFYVNITAKYNANPSIAILPPRSSQRLMVTREESEETLKHRQSIEQVFVWSGIVTKDDIQIGPTFPKVEDSKELPMVLTEITQCTSNELIQLDPPELSFPFLPNRLLISSVEIVNITDFNVGFTVCTSEDIAWMYTVDPNVGIVPPRSTQRVVIKRVLTEKDLLDVYFQKGGRPPGLIDGMSYGQGKFFVHNMIVDEGVEAEYLMNYKPSTNIELPVVFKKGENYAYPPVTNSPYHDLCKVQLIRFNPPRLSFPFLPNKTLLSSVNMVNNTDYSVGFHSCAWNAKARYYTEPRYGILPPRSTQKLVVKRVPTENDPQGMKCKDNYILWNAIVTEHVEANDLISCIPWSKGGTDLPIEDIYDDAVEQDKGTWWPGFMLFPRFGMKFEHRQLPIVLRKISPSMGNEVIEVEPPELCFPFLPNGTRKTSINIVNISNYLVGFNTFENKANVARYNTEPPCGIVPPNSTLELVVTRVAKEDAEALEDMMHCRDKYFLWSSFVTRDVDAIDLNRCTSERESKELPIFFAKESSSELIRLDPPELYLPSLSNRSVLSSVNIVNVTDHSISFSICTTKSNSASYCTDLLKGILSPKSTQVLMVTRVAMKKKPRDRKLEDKCLLYSRIVPEGVQGGGISDHIVERETKVLPIVLTKTKRLGTTEELIRFDPPELSFPFLPNKTVVSSVTIINNTNLNIGFCVRDSHENAGMYKVDPDPRILPPRSSHRILVKRVPTEEHIQCQGMLFVWNMIVVEGVEAENLVNYLGVGNTKKLPILLTKTIQCTSNELIQFDPPQLCFPFMPNKTLLSSVNIVNITYHSIVFCNYVWNAEARYYTEPRYGILPPQSTQKLVVKRVPMYNEPQDIKCNDKYILWNAIVTKGVEASDLNFAMNGEQGTTLPNHDLYDQTVEQAKGTLWSGTNLLFYGCVARQKENVELPIVLTQAQPICATGGSSWWPYSLSFATGRHQNHQSELVKIEPPILCFPFLPSEDQRSSIKIVNITDHFVGFNMFEKKTNVALYNTNPLCGILPPRSTQELVVTRVAKEVESLKDKMHSKDKYFFWSSFVTQDVDAFHLKGCTSENESKDLPIVFTETSSNDLIKFDPAELYLPMFSNKSVLSSVSIINVTDHYISYNTCANSNSARYYTDPSEGILKPRSTELLMVIRVPEEKEQEDTNSKDKYLAWCSVVNEGLEDSDVVNNIFATKITELPIVPTEISPTTYGELIEFHPVVLRFTILPNRKSSSSVDIVNTTESYIGFSTYSWYKNVAWYHTEPSRGILPPKSTKRLMVTREEKEGALEDIMFNDKYFVRTSIVPEGVKGSDLGEYMVKQESKELPIVLNKISLPISDQLIQIDPPQLCFPFLPNKTLMTFVCIQNITDGYVGFDTYNIQTGKVDYYVMPPSAILPPRSTQKLVVIWVPKEKELEDMPYNDKFFVRDRIVTESVEASDIIDYLYDDEGIELPMILNKISPPTPKELIQFHPPKLYFPLLPKAEVMSSVSVVNITDCYVAVKAYTINTDKVQYQMIPDTEILPPQSTKKLLVLRQRAESEVADMQCDDMFCVWNCVVTEGVESDDITDYLYDDECTKLPIVLNKASSPCTSEDLIRFDPPELRFPFVPNKTIVSSVDMVNNTDYSVAFFNHTNDENVAWYYAKPQSGIIPPKSTQRLVVKRVVKKEQGDMQMEDKLFLGSVIVTVGVEAVDLTDLELEEDPSMVLPIVIEKTRLLCSSEELIQFNPPQLRFLFQPNNMQPLSCFIEIVNVTDYCVGFNAWLHKCNSARYSLYPCRGILTPRSRLKIKVTRFICKNESEDLQCKDVVGVWNGIVTKGVEASDFTCYKAPKQSRQLSVVLTRPGEISSSKAWLGRFIGKA